MLASGFFLVPALLGQLTTLVAALPVYFTNAPPWLAKPEQLIISSLSASLNFISFTFSLLFSSLTIIFLAFYFSLDRPKISQEIFRLVPKPYLAEAHFLNQVINSSFAQFFRVQTIFGIIFGLLTFLIMMIFKIPFALLSSLLAGILTIIPLIGPLLALIPPSFFAFSQSTAKGGLTLLILFLLQQAEFNALGPKLWGSAFRIHPAVVLLSFLLGYKITGIWGALFAIPLFSILFLTAQELYHHWLTKENPHLGTKG